MSSHAFQNDGSSVVRTTYGQPVRQMESPEELREPRLGVVRDVQAQHLASLGLSRLTRLEIGGGYHNPICQMKQSSSVATYSPLSPQATG